MSLKIKQSRDVEDVIRLALAPYLTAYCRPYPANPHLPNVLIQQAGGNDDGNDIDTTTIVLDARATTEEDASRLLRMAVGALRAIATQQTTPLRDVVVNTSGGWGRDPNDPTVALYSANLSVVTHKETTTIPEQT